MSLALILACGIGATACSPNGSAVESPSVAEGGAPVGAIGLSLQLAPGVDVVAARYSITGPASFSRSGSFNVIQSPALSAIIGGIPVGGGYLIAITAATTAESAACSGTSAFAVTSATTAVAVHLTCHGPVRTGGILVSGTINVCPVVDAVSANPAQATVGGSIALAAVAHDADGAPSVLSYQWAASSGALTNASTSTAEFTCVVPGPTTITVTASDGDASAGCPASVAVQVTCSIPGAGQSPNATTIVAVYGDSPYGTSPTDTAQLAATPAFIDAINADPDVALVLHVGDIHSGKQYCTEAYDRSIYDLWTAFADPLVYTPGDNEWSDCHKVAQGGGTYNPATHQVDLVVDASGNPVDYAGGDPLANLALVRSVFFATPGATLGRSRKAVFSQGQVFDPAHPADGHYVENVMWEQSNVLFVTLNLPGGSNNDSDVWYGAPVATAAQTQEIVDRTGADLRWLDTAFAQAEADGVAAVVLDFQADMWDPEKGAAHQAAYEPFVQSIAAHATAFGKPVLAFNGDSHVYQSHNPLSPTDALSSIHPGYDVPNFHRIVVHGSTFPLEWLRLTVDPHANAPQAVDSNAFGPFRWDRVLP